MTDFLTSAGLSPPTGAQIMESIATLLRASPVFGPGLSISGTTATGQLIGAESVVMADLWAAVQANYDAWSIRATGAALDNIFSLFGVERLDATKARGWVRCYGTNGTVIPPAADPPTSGGVVRRVSDGALFNVLAGEDGPWTIASGYVDVLVEAQVAGALQVANGQIGGDVGSADRTASIVFAVSGWSGVWNPAAEGGGKPTLMPFISGTNVETDAQYRARFLDARKGSGHCTDQAIQTAVAQAKTADGKTFLESAFVVSNRELEPSGSQPGKSFWVSVWPNDLSEAEKQAVLAAIAANNPAGIKNWPGPALYSPVTGTVTAANGQAIDVGFTYALENYGYFIIFVSVTSAFPGDGVQQIRDIVDAYGAGLRVGDGIAPLPLQVAIFGIGGVADCLVQQATSTNPSLVAGSTILTSPWPADAAPVAGLPGEIIRIDGQTNARTKVEVHPV